MSPHDHPHHAPFHSNEDDYQDALDECGQRFVEKFQATRVNIEGATSALCFVKGPFTHYCTKGQSHVMFQGEVGVWPGKLDLPALNVRRNPCLHAYVYAHASYFHPQPHTHKYTCTHIYIHRRRDTSRATRL